MTLDKNKLRELGQLAREKKAFIRTSEDAVYDGARISPYPELDALLAELEAAEQPNTSQAEMIDGYISLKLAAAESGVTFSWEETPIGKRATAHNERAESAEERVRELTQEVAGYESVKDSCVCFWCAERFPYPREGTHEEQATALTAHAMKCATNPIHKNLELQRRLSVMETALRNLVEKLKLILPRVDAMCVMESVHGRPYRGPTIVDELATAAKALSDQGGNNGA